MKQFTTEDCAFCFVSKGLATGCLSDREPSERLKCSKCGSLLPPRGKIEQVRYFAVLKNRKIVSDGYFMKVLREADAESEWYLCHVRGGKENFLFCAIGLSAPKVKEIIVNAGGEVTWPTTNRAKFKLNIER